MNPLFAFQLRRVGRNRQYLLFTVLLPALFTVFFTKIFGGLAAGPAEYQEEAARYMVSMMAYGGLGAALGATIRISFDRASGWLRQLRVTPVSQTEVFGVDVAVGALLTLPSLVVVALVGRFVNDVQLDLSTWLTLVGALWAGSITFVALGLLIGLALDERAAGGAIGFVGVVLAALGGLWAPVEVFPDSMVTLAHAMPSYWYADLGRDIAAGTAPSGQAVLVLAGFTAGFAALAVLVARRRPLYAVAG
ncbi:ABC transporter permease [Blastococcus sp. CT_GayMR16]|uniref:ABC transporter permease n=1 Tax=Blastococcus sp. CT_GayMR16 TaxID=2559607 RepID=UPI001073F427|nr:ABC transporter permease [Blastococcus sp. CT_GayMR16]TFV91249.1 ABC transporter permease [Blastococcus sp. CT_GayMR16]